MYKLVIYFMFNYYFLILSVIITVKVFINKTNFNFNVLIIVISTYPLVTYVLLNYQHSFNKNLLLIFLFQLLLAAIESIVYMVTKY